MRETNTRGAVSSHNHRDGRLIIPKGQGAFADAGEEWLDLPYRSSDEGLIIRVRIGRKNHNMLLDRVSTFSIVRKSRLEGFTEMFACNKFFRNNDDKSRKTVDFMLSDLSRRGIWGATSIDGGFGNFEADDLLSIYY